MTSNGDWPEEAVNFVQAIADTKMILSHRYAEWMLAGPGLEDDITGAGAAQDEIGHVRQLYRLLEDQGRERDWLEGEREPQEYYNARTLDKNFDTWIEFIATVGPTDRATWYLLDAITHDDFKGLVEKIGQDEYFHLEYHDGRFETLIEEEAEELQDTLEGSIPKILEFIGPSDYDEENDPLVQAGFTDRPIADIREAFLDRYDSMFEGTPVSLKNIDRTKPRLEEWDENRRRVEEGAISESVVESLRGTKNKEFAME
ncbi:MAG: Phenylacetic acid catabolic protein [Halobacteria archaeon]|nr:Phenylacetic acid catabolic protein [Halobacteria archaeon]